MLHLIVGPNKVYLPIYKKFGNAYKVCGFLVMKDLAFKSSI